MFLCFAINKINAQVTDNDEKISGLIREIDDLSNDSVKVERILELTQLLPEDEKQRKIYLQNGIKLAKKIDMNEAAGLLHFDLAWYYFYCDNKKGTLDNFKKAIQYSPDSEILVYSYGYLSNNASRDNDHELALQYARKACEIAKKDPEGKHLADALMFLGDVYRYQDNTMEANKYYLQALNDLKFAGNLPWSMLYVIINVYLGDTSITNEHTISRYAIKAKQLYEESSPRKKQMWVYHIINATNASIFTTENAQIQKLILENQKKQSLLYICIIIFLLVIALLLVIQVHTKRKANLKLKKANEIKSRLFVILNHDLKQPIAGLISYFELTINHPGTVSQEETLAFHKKTKETATRLLANMEQLLLWAKDQMHSFELDIQPVHISEVFKHIRSFFDYEENVEFRFDIKKDIVVKTDANYLKAIVRNLSLNAIAATRDLSNPLIIWKIVREGNKVVLSVTNYGGKISQEAIDFLMSDNVNRINSEGAGLVIVKNLMQVIKGEIEVETEKHKTTFKLIFKDYNDKKKKKWVMF